MKGESESESESEREVDCGRGKLSERAVLSRSISHISLDAF